MSERVLICAPSNTAVDLLGARLDQRGLDYIRVGRESRVQDDLQHHGLYLRAQQLLKSSGGVPDCRGIGFSTIAPSRRNFEPLASRQADWVQGIDAELERLEAGITPAQDAPAVLRDAIKVVLNAASIVLCTLSTAQTWELLESKKFRFIIVDEAAQASLPETFIPLQMLNLDSGHLALIGGTLQCPTRHLHIPNDALYTDHQQLGPMVSIPKDHPSHQPLTLSLFEMLYEHNRPNANISHMLLYVVIYPLYLNNLLIYIARLQYRMHEEISEWPSHEFYNDELRNAAPVRQSRSDHGVQFYNINGHQIQESGGPSQLNDKEALFIVNHLISQSGIFTSEKLTIGVICMYSAQVRHIQDICCRRLHINLFERVTFGTVDGFQGGERDVIYVSFVRSHGSGGIGFLDNPNRLNVAVTRAKKLCVMVGNLDFLSDGSEAFGSLADSLYRRGRVIWK